MSYVSVSKRLIPASLPILPLEDLKEGDGSARDMAISSLNVAGKKYSSIPSNPEFGLRPGKRSVQVLVNISLCSVRLDRRL